MYCTSTTHDTYNNKKRCFSSMRNKPLEPYNPTAYRSRLSDENYRTTFGNFSHVEIGDRYILYQFYILST